MKMRPTKLSNIPFLDGGDRMYSTTNKSHFKLLDDTSKPKISPVCRPASHFSLGEQKKQIEYQTETGLSFPSHPIKPVMKSELTHLMHITNFKMHYKDGCGDFQTTQSDFKPMSMTAVQLIRPTTNINLSMSESKCPETMYTSCYSKHRMLPIIRAKETANAGVGPSLKQDKKDDFSTSYHEQFQYRRAPTPTPLPSIEQQRIQYSSVVMGDKEKILDRQTGYSSSFIPLDVHCSAKFREGLFTKTEKPQPINLRELPDDKWTTTSSDEFCAHTFGPIHRDHRSPTLSSVFKGEMFYSDQERLATTNQCFYPKINNTQFPVHVDGASIRTLSNVEFGRPNLTDRFYSTTSHEQFPSKEAVRPKPQTFPPSHMMFEQEPDQMFTTAQVDFVPLNCKRQELSPSQLQRVKESHIRPWHSKRDFRTTHNETFVPKPYCKAVLENPPQHISHMLF